MQQCLVKKGAEGFTLIELLVVLLIIAIISSVAILALGDMGKNRKAQYFVEQLQSTLAYAQDYAVTQPTTILFHLNHDDYQFKKLHMTAHHDGSLSYDWQPLRDSAYHDSIPSYLTLSLASATPNTIQINSNGTMTPFTLRVSIFGEQTYYVLTGNEAGSMRFAKKTSDDS